MGLLTHSVVIWADGVSVRLSLPGAPEPAELHSLGTLGGARIVGGGETAQQKIWYEEDDRGLFRSLRLLEETDYQITVTLPLGHDDCVRRRDASGAPLWPFTNPRLVGHLRLLEPSLWKVDDGGCRTTIAGFLNSRSNVGTVDLSVLDERYEVLVEIFPAKFEYVDDFHQLLTELSEFHLRLAFDLGSIGGTGLVASRTGDASLETAAFHIRRMMRRDNLPDAVESVLREPARRLRWREQNRSPGRVLRPDARLIARRAPGLPLRKGGRLAARFSGYSPELIPTRRGSETSDTPENRYIKSVLEDLRETANRVYGAASRERRHAAAAEAAEWRGRFDDWLSAELWKSVGKLTRVPYSSTKLRSAVGYRDVFRLESELRQALTLPWSLDAPSDLDAALGDLRPVYRLYEYWCFFAMHAALEEEFGPDLLRGAGLVTTDGELSIGLGPARTQYKMVDASGLEWSVSFFFQRGFTRKGRAQGEWEGSYSLSFEPDMTLLVERGGQRHWAVFDAKYKLDRAWWMAEDGQQSSRRDFKAFDLEKMHAYRDAILGTRTAYIIFPGPEHLSSLEGPFVRAPAPVLEGLRVPSVGAIRLRPGSRTQRQHLRAFLGELLTVLTAGSNYQEETAFD